MRAVLLFPGLLLLSSCATYDPAEVCSAEWISPRLDRAVDRIESDTSRVIRSLRSAGESFARGRTPGPLKMLSLTRSLKTLERELTDGRGVKDLRILADTCDDPVILTDAFSDYLDGLGLSDGLERFIVDSGIIETLTRYDPDDNV